MSSKYGAIFDDDGTPFFGGPRPVSGWPKSNDFDVVIDGDDDPRYMGSPDDILDWFYDIGQNLGPRPFKVLVQRVELDRYLSLDEYFDYFEYPLGLRAVPVSQ